VKRMPGSEGEVVWVHAASLPVSLPVGGKEAVWASDLHVRSTGVSIRRKDRGKKNQRASGRTSWPKRVTTPVTFVRACSLSLMNPLPGLPELDTIPY